ncbi:bifunctional adenosylcobinamide kinase/adenosylcobinamide-phosphate guanylyltransferase [Paenibacillus apiarius]|uniref:Bifunctional adenosylcobinamide kinase/adenosylcobinamide-phosphate guanylyltransferase n=1 Tax=Paenibacillus apiarius TaxID=46240 RepID=A0ABT4DRE8_9BACL|nr:bifunctional adenosylcobinamide kinase/adenosylcobinamide-phosphate guanylyltransferase [Paenibacillus apiarius]MCY9516681.1 bifunctional adenosylcobinamide kinase/adenosylcobinamide-phosphate guanylyltransferase [Paenibacillus apiarius]MCY9519921.1 bifunctional adenosylcobinamide kinase/adenosylcobinamide-phosphate guanylyltransferase [Paenibacillus apiarius]MCY9553841.1 bifunctional adenosylcobinamide kinase/adenosylcobinamide-phosphate guanylyltransferase [Paenibacillus apiarius]MCY955755
MIIGVTGGAGSGKTPFALKYAATFGREGLYVVTHATPLPDAMPAPPHFTWQTIHTEYSLPAVLHRINEESNLYRAERRVLVIDSLTSYLCAAHQRFMQEHAGSISDGDYMEMITAAREELQHALLSFQGKVFVITDEPPGYTAFTDRKERCYITQHAALNLELARRSHQWFRLTAGIPEELSATRFRG